MDARLARGSSGIDAAGRLHREWRIRRVFLPGNLDPATRERLSELEPYAMLSKPATPARPANALASVR